MRLGVAALNDPLIDAAWAGYRRARDGQAALLVLHVEMRYGQLCIKIVHDAKKYQALMHKMGACASVAFASHYQGVVQRCRDPRAPH